MSIYVEFVEIAFIVNTSYNVHKLNVDINLTIVNQGPVFSYYKREVT